MRLQCYGQPRFLRGRSCMVAQARPSRLPIMLHSMSPVACKSAATEAMSFEELIATGEASATTSGAAKGPEQHLRQRPERRSQQQNQRQHQEHVDIANIKVKAGDTVLGRVVVSNAKGAKVQLLDGSDVIAYMPVKEAPFHLREADEEDVWTQQAKSREPCVDEGLVREFRVVAIQHGNDRQSGQPLVSAREMDQDLMWARALQIMQVCVECKENVKLRIDGANSGGVTSRLTGLSLFVPVSQLEKQEGGEWWSEETMEAEFVGKELPMAVVEVSRKNRKVVASLTRALENTAVRSLEVGNLVEGTVRRVEAFGVFVGINGSRESGLVHISNISRQRVPHPNAAFKVGDRIMCIVMGLDPDYSNISLSTAELEVEEGDVMRDKEKMWETAGEQARLFQEHLKSLKQSGFDFEGYYQESGHA